MTDQSTKAGRQGPRTAGNRPHDSGDLDARSAEIDRHFDSLDDKITAAMERIDRGLERRNLELAHQVDDVVQSRVLENARRLEGIYQGPEGATHYQEMLGHLTGDSSAKEASPSLETPDPLSGLTLRSPATLEAPATPRIAALLEAVSADDRRPSGDQHAQSAPTIRGVSDYERQMDEGRLRLEYELISSQIRTNVVRVDVLERFYGPDSVEVQECKKKTLEQARERDRIKVQIENLRQQGGQNQTQQQPLNPPQLPPNPAQADPQRAGPISESAMDRAKQDMERACEVYRNNYLRFGVTSDTEEDRKYYEMLHKRWVALNNPTNSDAGGAGPLNTPGNSVSSGGAVDSDTAQSGRSAPPLTQGLVR